MASAIDDFITSLNLAVNAMIGVREDIAAFQRLASALDAPNRASVRQQIIGNLIAAQALAAALAAP